MGCPQLTGCSCYAEHCSFPPLARNCCDRKCMPWLYVSREANCYVTKSYSVLRHYLLATNHFCATTTIKMQNDIFVHSSQKGKIYLSLNLKQEGSIEPPDTSEIIVSSQSFKMSPQCSFKAFLPSPSFRTHQAIIHTNST